MCYGIQCMIENANKAVLKEQEAKFKAERKAELKEQESKFNAEKKAELKSLQKSLVKSLYEARLPMPQMVDIYANTYHYAPSTARKHVAEIIRSLSAS